MLLILDYLVKLLTRYLLCSFALCFFLLCVLCLCLYGQLLVPLAFLSNGTLSTYIFMLFLCNLCPVKQESPAIADKPARRESLPKIAPIRRAYNVVADDTGLSSSFV